MTKKEQELPKGTYYVSNGKYSGLSKTANFNPNVRLADVMRHKPKQR